MPKTAESKVPTPQNSSTGLTLFPSLVIWEDPWEPDLDLAKLRRNAAKFETIRQLSENPRHGDPLTTLDRGRIADLVKPFELSNTQSAVLIDDAHLIAAWYELPQHRKRIYMGQKALLEALDEAANPVRNLYDRLGPYQYETESLLEEMPSSVVGSQRDFDVVELARKAVEFSSLVDRILEFLRPHNRRRRCQRDGQRIHVPVAGGHEPRQDRQSVPLFPLLARGDPTGSDDVRPVPAEPAQRRGPVVRTRHRSLPRDRAALVEPLWSALCGRHPSPADQPDARVPPLEVAP